MVHKTLLIILSVLALTSAQLLNVPKRARGGNKLVGKSPQEQDGAFGRRASSNLRNGNMHLRQLEQSMSMSMDFTVADTADEPPIVTSDTTVDDTADEAPIVKPEVTAVPAPAPAAGDQACQIDDDCVGEGEFCQCRFNCIFCSDITFIHFNAFCGVCQLK